jgi:AcrR family transcriptional regulator
MYIQLEQDESIDPRVLRTRELLINGFAKLMLKHKSIRKVSVQSITKQAGVNRVTFYAHFTDKYELLNVWARVMFRQSVAKKLPENAGYNIKNLELLVNATLDFFSMRSERRKRIYNEFDSMFEAAIQHELNVLLKGMLENEPSYNMPLAPENMSTFLSWSIFGCANDWSLTQKKQSKELFSKQLVAMCASIIT